MAAGDSPAKQRGRHIDMDLQAAANLDFELAAKLRDRLFELQGKSPDEIPQETVSLPQRRKSRKRNKYLKA